MVSNLSSCKSSQSCKFSTAAFNFSACCGGNENGFEEGNCGNLSVVPLSRKMRLSGIASKVAIKLCSGDNDAIDDVGGVTNNSAIMAASSAEA